MDAETPERTLDEKTLARFRASTLEYLEYLERGYAQNPNPVHVWRAIQASTFAQLPIPDWTRPYLMTCAHSICALAEKPPAKVAPAVAKALGFADGGRTGRGSRFSEVRDTAWEQHAEMVEGYLALGDKPQFACETVADLYGVSSSKVRRDHQRLLGSRKSALSENGNVRR
jgi:hypothetical protein